MENRRYYAKPDPLLVKSWNQRSIIRAPEGEEITTGFGSFSRAGLVKISDRADIRYQGDDRDRGDEYMIAVFVEGERFELSVCCYLEPDEEIDLENLFPRVSFDRFSRGEPGERWRLLGRGKSRHPDGCKFDRKIRQTHQGGRREYQAIDCGAIMMEEWSDNRKSGRSRHESWEAAKAVALLEAEALDKFAREPSAYTAVAEVRCVTPGIEAVAVDSCGGIVADYCDRSERVYLAESARDVLHNAIVAVMEQIRDRHKTMVRKVSGIVESSPESFGDHLETLRGALAARLAELGA